MFRRTLLRGLAAAPLLPAAGAFAQQPATTRIVIPFAAGGPIDLIGRLLAEKLGSRLGSTFIVDNRPGGNGVVAGQYVFRAPTDGSVLYFGAVSTFCITPNLEANMPFDPRAFTPVTRVVVSGSGLAINAAIPARTVPELVAWARGRGQPLKVASNGNGSIAHAWLELFRKATGLDILHVPYRGAGPALVAITAGEVDAGFSDLLVQLPLARDNRIRILGLVGTERHRAAPDIPTIAEQGFPGVNGLSWSGIVAPPATPLPLRTRLAEAIAEALSDPAIEQRLISFGSAPAPMTPPEFGRYLEAETAFWAQVIRDARITMG
ncbi:tripartite tricarboxylate transporter substrate binding protein [Roseomonas sp. AR75]|uniref:Bug family tripartite tricarboxylate transporter substrate binding protein n=1 Tax=Roseomonas sp. AR75 TaxID=2562311 RepID=UPI001485AC3A|nr:tripartite tricarboxylate transporter substrate binding protein [Roseomonas sp. AR75]